MRVFLVVLAIICAVGLTLCAGYNAGRGNVAGVIMDCFFIAINLITIWSNVGSN